MEKSKRIKYEVKAIDRTSGITVKHKTGKIRLDHKMTREQIAEAVLAKCKIDSKQYDTEIRLKQYGIHKDQIEQPDETQKN